MGFYDRFDLQFPFVRLNELDCDGFKRVFGFQDYRTGQGIGYQLKSFVFQDLCGHYSGDVARQSIDHDFDWVHLLSP
jgi:hypothetical protein